MTSHDSTPELDRPIDPAPEDLFLERMVYRCACGTSYQVDLEAGGVCPTCNRPVRAEALRHALLQTVTHGDLRHATVIHEEEQEDPWIGMSLGHFWDAVAWVLFTEPSIRRYSVTSRSS
jgi:hypothetical protein